jgi:hypothetical protein
MLTPATYNLKSTSCLHVEHANVVIMPLCVASQFPQFGPISTVAEVRPGCKRPQGSHSGADMKRPLLLAFSTVCRVLCHSVRNVWSGRGA